MLSNADIYLAIAVEALEASKRLDEASRRPKPDGQPGFVITYDPARGSFKQSLIAIVFAGIYLDALLYIVGVTKLGKSHYRKIEHAKYETKLEALGVTDEKIVKTCEEFRKARNDLVHEKAIDPEEADGATILTAQHEAEIAVTFVQHMGELLRPPVECRSGETPARAASVTGP